MDLKFNSVVRQDSWTEKKKRKVKKKKKKSLHQCFHLNTLKIYSGLFSFYFPGIVPLKTLVISYNQYS